MKNIIDDIRNHERRIEDLEKKGFNNPWIAPSLLNGWIVYDGTYNPPGYFKDTNGIVHLRGMVKNGNMNQPIFQLPSGYRPEFRMLFGNFTNAGAGRADVSTDGYVWPIIGSNGWFSLDGLTFRAF